MAKTLDVYLFRNLVGHLVQDYGGQMIFDYTESWIKIPNACPLQRLARARVPNSVSICVQPKILTIVDRMFSHVGMTEVIAKV